MRKSSSALRLDKLRLYLLPFDHRRSFIELLKAKEPLSSNDKKKIEDYKQVIYSAFQQAVARGLPKDKAGILVDETYGQKILLDARKKGFITCYTLEKSGQEELVFDKVNYKRRLKLFQPTYAKVLVRYNPGDDRALNQRQARKLAVLSSYLKQQSINFLLEVLVTPTLRQLKTAGSKLNYEQKLRPALTVRAVKELRLAGVRPQIWKLEGLASLKKWSAVAKELNSGAKIIILGRGESRSKVEQWVTLAAKIPVVIGFAVGRTIFEKPLQDLQNKKINKLQAINQIMLNFRRFVRLFEEGKKR